MAQTITGIFTADELHEAKQYFNPCQLRPFHPHGCPKPLTPHHCVPDHCWKPQGGNARINLGGTTPPTNMTREDGLCICIDGPDKYKGGSTEGTFQGSTTGMWSNRPNKDTTLIDRFNDSAANTIDAQIESIALKDHFEDLYNQQRPTREQLTPSTLGMSTNGWAPGTEQPYYQRLGTHGKIHHIFDAAEDELARQNQTQGLGDNVATLSQLEKLAATVIAKVTGCDAKDLKRQMKSYHNSKGIRGETLLRARADGKAPAAPQPPNALGMPTNLSKAQRTTSQQGVATFLNNAYNRLGI